jgi:hypothetical protein
MLRSHRAHSLSITPAATPDIGPRRDPQHGFGIRGNAKDPVVGKARQAAFEKALEFIKQHQ